MKPRPRLLSDGEWSNKSRRRKDGSFVHLIRCCDCGLDHIIQYEVVNDKLRFRAWRQPKRKGAKHVRH